MTQPGKQLSCQQAVWAPQPLHFEVLRDGSHISHPLSGLGALGAYCLPSMVQPFMHTAPSQVTPTPQGVPLGAGTKLVGLLEGSQIMHGLPGSDAPVL